LFLRVAAIPEILLATTGVNTRLLYFFAVPAILLSLISGAAQRTFQRRAGLYWAGFVAWMILATPFSSWPGGSVGRLIGYGRVELVMLMIVAGLAVNWKELRALLYTMAAGGLTTILFARIFLRQDVSGRFTMNDVSGSVGNSNDLAAQVILVSPFIWYAIKDTLLPAGIRWLFWPVIGYGIVVVLGTGSRGGLVALVGMALFVMFRASVSQRALMLAGVVVVVLLSPVFLPQATLTRLGSLFGQRHEEADESGKTRSYLFRQSLIFAAEHPVFGVGPGQFSNFEGKTRLEEGHRGAWSETHNVFTQVASECGIPALLFFAGGLGSAFFAVSKLYKRARREGVPEVANVAFCYMISFVGYLITILFLAHAYHFQPIVMVGLGICIQNVATPYLDTRRAAVAAARA
jgi:O-antigen ligase